MFLWKLFFAPVLRQCQERNPQQMRYEKKKKEEKKSTEVLNHLHDETELKNTKNQLQDS